MLVGQDIGPFHIEKELGSGAMGTVYRAQFNNKGKVQTVAIKMVSLALLGDDKAMARFEREANILKQLKHPHIVRLLATGKYKQTPFIAMEYVDGESMDRILLRRDRFGWDEVFTYGKQLCDALQHAHDKGIIHRDLKPSNLMVTNTGVMKLTDFGIAKDTDVTALTGANSAIGTAAYMSPEQCRGDKSISAKSDLYSLGVVFYELVTGRKPFMAENSMEMFLKHVHDVPVRPSKYVPDLPVWVDNLIMFLMEKKPESRPLDATTVAKMISDIELKVQDQKSVGAEVASARRVDRKIGEVADDADRDAAMALRGKKKKKKKKREEATKKNPWGTIGAFAGVILLVAGLLTWQLWPTSLAGAYAKVESADADSKLDSVAEFLKKHGSKSGPEIDKAKGLFKDQLVDNGERQLVKRHQNKLTKLEEGEDKDVFDNIWLAFDAEDTGDLTRAGACWKTVLDKSSEPEAAKYTEKANACRLGTKWIAEKRLGEITGLNKRIQEIQDKVSGDIFNETPTTYDSANPEGVAYKALAFERFGDPLKARGEWAVLVNMTGKDLKNHSLWLMANARRRAIQIDAGKEAEANKKRIEHIRSNYTTAEAAWDAVKDDPNKRKERRDAHNRIFEIATLYRGDSDSDVKAIADKASQLLAKYPKANVD